jgi:hypothetical protein
LHHAPDDTGAMQISGGRLLLLAVALRHEEDDLVLGQRRFDRRQ